MERTKSTESRRETYIYICEPKWVTVGVPKVQHAELEVNQT